MEIVIMQDNLGRVWTNRIHQRDMNSDGAAQPDARLMTAYLDAAAGGSDRAKLIDDSGDRWVLAGSDVTDEVDLFTYRRVFEAGIDAE